MAQLSPEDLTTGSYLGSKTNPFEWDTVKIGKGNDPDNLVNMSVGWFCELFYKEKIIRL